MRPTMDQITELVTVFEIVLLALMLAIIAIAIVNAWRNK
jgi:hypothetical protein